MITLLTAEGSTVPADAQALIGADDAVPRRLITVTLELSGSGATHATAALGAVVGVVRVEQRPDEGD
ncbi:MAG: hypothetical protein JO281_18350 [Pseudonocardiales bacterium]|nr:hypothetical protein [Pseudonocardiales bacterium]